MDAAATAQTWVVVANATPHTISALLDKTGTWAVIGEQKDQGEREVKDVEEVGTGQGMAQSGSFQTQVARERQQDVSRASKQVDSSGEKRGRVEQNSYNRGQRDAERSAKMQSSSLHDEESKAQMDRHVDAGNHASEQMRGGSKQQAKHSSTSFDKGASSSKGKSNNFGLGTSGSRYKDNQDADSKSRHVGGYGRLAWGAKADVLGMASGESNVELEGGGYKHKDKSTFKKRADGSSESFDIHGGSAEHQANAHHNAGSKANGSSSGSTYQTADATRSGHHKEGQTALDTAQRHISSNSKGEELSMDRQRTEAGANGLETLDEHMRSQHDEEEERQALAEGDMQARSQHGALSQDTNTWKKTDKSQRIVWDTSATVAQFSAPSEHQQVARVEIAPYTVWRTAFNASTVMASSNAYLEVSAEGGELSMHVPVGAPLAVVVSQRRRAGQTTLGWDLSVSVDKPWLVENGNKLASCAMRALKCVDPEFDEDAWWLEDVLLNRHTYDGITNRKEAEDKFWAWMQSAASNQDLAVKFQAQVDRALTSQRDKATWLLQVLANRALDRNESEAKWVKALLGRELWSKAKKELQPAHVISAKKGPELLTFMDAI